MLLFFTAATSGGGGGPTTSVSPPTNLRVTRSGPKYVDLAWDTSVRSESVGVSYYKQYVNGVWDGIAVPHPVNSWSQMDLTPGVGYSFYVSAVDSAGVETATSNTVTATTATNRDSGIFKGFRNRQRYNLNKGMYG